MKNDVLLESFLEFELSDSEKSKVIGGDWATIGCAQNGSSSYADYRTGDGSILCNVLVSSNDGSGYMSSCEFQMDQL
jgi:hypothetical protein